VREEHGLRVCESRVLRKIFGPENRGKRRVEKTTYLGAVCSVPLKKYNLHDDIKKNEMGAACGTFGR
jgi:hypothetical protein